MSSFGNEYDLAPDYPRLFAFIEFWQEEIEGPLKSVRFVHRKQLRAAQWINIAGIYHVGDGRLRLH